MKKLLLLITMLMPCAAFAADDAAKVPAAPKAPAPAPAARPAAEPDVKIASSVETGNRAPKPFGANLFSSQFASGSKEPLNPDYQIVPGDQVDVQVWGAVDLNTTAIVDSQGNIFLPDVGPINVKGIKQSELNTFVKNQVSKVYKENVELYVNLRGSLPVSVFVSGAVKSPGRYVGTSADSVIDYIYKAGSIDAERGSYRVIKIMRNGAEVGQFDTYDFLISGNMPKFQIREGDTILVTERGKVVTAIGSIKNSYSFEFKTTPISGSELIKYTSPLPGATDVLIVGIRDSKPYKLYLPIIKFAETKIEDGDTVNFLAGEHQSTIQIAITGAHKGPKAMVVPINAKLQEVLNNIPVDKDISNTGAVFIRRKSVADSQKRALDESLRRLQETLLLSRASGETASNASPISEAEVNALESFMTRVKAVKPEGRVVVAGKSGVSNIALEDSDEIVIPQKTDLVMVNGEVLVPQAIVWKDGDSVTDYVEKAGGYSERANHSNRVVVKANGQTVIDDGDIQPGDEIMVLPEIKMNTLETTGKVVDILYKVAIAAVVPLSLP